MPLPAVPCPLRNSSEAPPPVEICVILSAKSELFHSRSGIASADHCHGIIEGEYYEKERYREDCSDPDPEIHSSPKSSREAFSPQFQTLQESLLRLQSRKKRKNVSGIFIADCMNRFKPQRARGRANRICIKENENEQRLDHRSNKRDVRIRVKRAG